MKVLFNSNEIELKEVNSKTPPQVVKAIAENKKQQNILNKIKQALIRKKK